jgi:hypothetical protein
MAHLVATANTSGGMQAVASNTTAAALHINDPIDKVALFSALGALTHGM